MGRQRVRQVNENRRGRSRGGAVIVGIAIVLLFALVGVISAGAYVANHVGGTSKSQVQTTPLGHGPTAALLELERAHAQATAIVRQAQNAGQSIVSSATSKANKQAKAILEAAKNRAQRTSATTGAITPPAVIATPLPALVSPNTTGSGLSASGVTGSAGTVVATPIRSVPDLSGLPASWKVVGYNASFGTGPGSAGSITVVNRSNVTFRGTARVVYARGGSATAYFVGLVPGQTRVLALNGPAYRGGGYSIIVNPQ